MSFRVKNGLVSFIYMALCILFLSIARFNGFLLYGTVVFMMLIYYFLVYWLFNFDVYFQGFVTILLLPAILFGSYLLIYYNFIKEIQIIYQILFTGVFVVLLYYLVLTQNLINRSHFTNVSLSQAAIIVNNFYSIFGFFLACLSIFLVPDMSNITKIVVSILIFAAFYGIFVLVNSIEYIQFFFGMFSYVIFAAILILLYVSGSINPSTSVLTVLSMTVFFRGVTVISLYSFRKVINWPDILQILAEALVVGFITYLSII